jgi:hypothetical protein
MDRDIDISPKDVTLEERTAGVRRAQKPGGD